MVQVNWTLQAASDLKGIAEYISKDSKKYAKLQIVRIRLRTRILSSQIYSGKIVAEIGKNNIRELIEGNYRIIYKVVNDSRVDILTIHHSARDLLRRNIRLERKITKYKIHAATLSIIGCFEQILVS
jgi:plasmid stabilization system protein ParE